MVKVAELCGQLLFDCLSHEQLLAWPPTFTVCSACCIELIIHTAHPAVVSAEANCAAQLHVAYLPVLALLPDWLYVVCRLECSCILWRRANEDKFPTPL
jgi:hypothetical protein